MFRAIGQKIMFSGEINTPCIARVHNSTTDWYGPPSGTNDARNSAIDRTEDAKPLDYTVSEGTGRKGIPTFNASEYVVAPL